MRTFLERELKFSVCGEAIDGLDALTKAELLAVGTGHGLDVRTSMSKNELIAAIAANAR